MSAYREFLFLLLRYPLSDDEGTCPHQRGRRESRAVRCPSARFLAAERRGSWVGGLIPMLRVLDG
jgi:hypothetical protein